MPRSFELKLARALDHLNRLDGDMRAWLKGRPYSFSDELDPESRQDRPHRLDRVIIAEMTSSMPTAFGPLIGDVIYNMRSGLDHLAFDLARSHTGDPLPDDIAKGSEFPIFGDRPMTTRERENRIGGIAPAAQAIIEGLQPYHRQDGGFWKTHPLWDLQSLANIDKHRTLHLSMLSSTRLILKTNNAKIEVIDHVSETFEARTIIARYRIRILDRSKDVDVKCTPGLGIAFAEAFPVPRGVLHVLWRIHRFVAEEIVPPLTPFLSPWSVR